MTLVYFQEIPSLVALFFKLILLGYAAHSGSKNHVTRIFLVLLILFSAVNIIELGGMHYYYPHGLIPIVEKFGFAYFAMFIPVIAVILHLSLTLSFDSSSQSKWRPYFWLLYLPAIPLEYLLLFSDKLVAGFEPFRDSIQRSRGPLYFLFETYAIVYLLASFVNLLYGARSSRPSALARTRNRLWLTALLPIVFIFVYLIIASAVGWPKFTTTFYLPIGITFFLCITTYAIHEHRLFDIEFYIPWSKVRKRKTAFYDRIRAMIAEVADLASVNQAVERLSDTLRCPVALVGGPKAVLAAAGAPNMAAMPTEHLRRLDHIVVANEVVDRMPQLHNIMKQHGVAAVVPFYPHSQNAASWLLLGESFSEQVYSRLDFRMVEQLFDKMADLFLDKLLAMRTQLADAHRQIHTLEFRLQGMETNVATLQSKIEVLGRENLRLTREQAADTLLSASRPAMSGITITLLGRDKTMLKRLRARFPQAEHFVGADSSSFRRQPLPDVLICDVDADDVGAQRKLADLLSGDARGRAVLLYGTGAEKFSFEHRKRLRGSLIELLSAQLPDEAVIRKMEALVELRKSLHALTHADYPLAGRSPIYLETMGEIQRIARFIDPVLMKSADAGEAIAIGAYIHQLANTKGGFRVLQASKFLKNEASDDSAHSMDESLVALLADVRHGTLMIDNICALSNETWDRLLATTAEFAETRLVAACPTTANQPAELLCKPLKPLVIELPTLRERRLDLPALVHYYTLQFNLQAGTSRYLSQADVDDLMASDYPEDLSTLRDSVFDRLRAKERQTMNGPELETIQPDKTLDEYVAEFEAGLIEQTLKRCGGNKSKTARMLGLRPNTLHYKLERYGLLKEKQDR